MRILLVVIILTILFGANYYVIYRLWQMMPFNNVGKIFMVVIGVAAVLSPFVTIFLGNGLPLFISSLSYRIGTSWIIIFLYLLMTFLLVDLIRITHLLPVEKFIYNSWTGSGVLALVMTVIFTIGYFRYMNKDRVELTLAVEKNTPADESIKIVAISDLHLGYGIGKKEFESWVRIINSENPDIVLIAGDLSDNNIKTLYEQGIVETFKEIKSKHGVYAVLGNHDYMGTVSKSIGFMNDAGITLLRDSVALIDNMFYIIGRDDMTNSERKSIRELAASLDRSKPIIMLDHQPYNLYDTEKNNIDLQISGHTHHGQIWPLTWITDLIFENAYGYLKKGNSHFYVSSGIGIWGGKFRIGTRSEYVVINLKTNNYE